MVYTMRFAQLDTDLPKKWDAGSGEKYSFFLSQNALFITWACLKRRLADFWNTAWFPTFPFLKNHRQLDNKIKFYHGRYSWVGSKKKSAKSIFFHFLFFKTRTFDRIFSVFENRLWAVIKWFSQTIAVYLFLIFCFETVPSTPGSNLI